MLFTHNAHCVRLIRTGSPHFISAVADTRELIFTEEELESTGQKTPKRRLEVAACRFLARFVLQDPTIEITHDESGHPYLTEKSYHISLSHSSDYVALQLSRKYKCGIDVQRFEDRILRLKEKFLNAGELEFIAGLPEEERILYTTACWSVKECVYKIFGAGFIDYLEGFRIRPFQLNGKPIICDVSTAGIEESFSICYERDPDYFIAFRVEPEDK